MYTFYDYIEFANANELTLLDDRIPYSYKQPVHWQCNLCGSLLTKSLRDLYRADTVCHCRRRANAKSVDDYRALGARFNLSLKSAALPVNTRIPVCWVDQTTGQELMYSYRQLKNKVNRHAKTRKI